MSQYSSASVRPVARLIVLLFLAASTLVASETVVGGRAEARSLGETCALGSDAGRVDHVVYIQFNNVHLKRDNPNVPSDLEQMPSLLQFMTGQGTLLTNHHTPLIAHTGTDILSTLTGVYGDRNGVPVANTFRFYTTLRCHSRTGPTGSSASTGRPRRNRS